MAPKVKMISKKDQEALDKALKDPKMIAPDNATAFVPPGFAGMRRDIFQYGRVPLDPLGGSQSIGNLAICQPNSGGENPERTDRETSSPRMISPSIHAAPPVRSLATADAKKNRAM